ncbi:MAG TPA: quinohemoprotein amine dehydrogenase maturation protein, partial [Candidatus Eisenbacteria bacterium]|nr:quinohemoprotein amine dehydrogenase maturation protein [Candidatus Eisenbacteria bacterium]
ATNFVDAPEPLPDHFPLQTLVMNVTNQCNLSCQYCYEFGEDKIATPEGKKKFMDVETAKASVDYLLEQSAGRNAVHITFFGGETLMNFPLLRHIIDYSSEQAARKNVKIDFSLTTNATLLTSQIIDFLTANCVGVTVSIDGPKEMNDAFRVFSNGRGSYETMEPKVRELLARHHTRPIAARVTMTSHAMDVFKIYRHLKDDLGFHEVGFAPVTTSPDRLYSINESGMHSVFAQFGELAQEYLQFALRGELHGFSNVSDTLAELHQGVNKSHPCGAGLGLLGVGPSGDIAPCHRFVDSDAHVLGNVTAGIDKKKRSAFLDRGNINAKYACHTCWARPLCAGGCHHEALVRYGDTGHPNLHYCDWIRGWTNTCLEIYGALAENNPSFLEYFAERKAAS